jgi:ATP-dependent RNA helicase MSS116
MNEPMDIEKSNAPNGGARRGGGGRGAPRKRNNRKPSGEGRETNSKSNGTAKGSMPPVKRVKQNGTAGPKNSEPQKETKVVVATSNEGSAPKENAHITNNKFSELQICAESRRAMAEVFKYESMTVVQAETIPLILKGDDCLAKAKTGTGKTLAFMIPTIEKIQSRRHPANEIPCLVISPTRELAMQISAETEKLLTFHKTMNKVITCVGGTNVNKDLRAIKGGNVPFVVGTPGRLLDLLQNHGLAERMANLDCLVFDEADQLLDMGFRPDIERILRLLQPSVKTRQTLLFSATVPKTVTEIAKFAMRPKYNFVDTVGEDTEQTHLHVKQELIIAPQEKQVHAMASILAKATAEKPYKIIVFFTTARLTGFMAELFNSVSSKTGFNVLEIHSRKSQKQRQKASDLFRDGKNAVLFSSDVSARGMDYPDVTFVLQVGLTERASYIHRLGRTARAGKKGKGCILLAPYEKFHMAQKELTGLPLEAVPVPDDGGRSDGIADQALGNVDRDEALRLSAEQAYRAWLGYYNGALRKCGWDKKELVVQANFWAKEIGLKNQPALQKKTVGKMGLKGVPGLKLE